jgi:glycosyltransferase involved in cell wall biosynthesis
MPDTISVLIPVYNGARYLSECIASVCAQTRPAQAIILVDDGSEDETPRVAAEWGARIRYHRFPHGGLPRARNRGLGLVETDVVAFVDCDDIWLPEKLERQMAALRGQDGPAMVFGHVEQFVSGDLTPAEAARIRLRMKPLPGQFPSTFLARKADCDRVGAFDESVRIGEFIEWCSRASDAGLATIMVPDVVCRRRLHRDNMGRGGAATHGDYVHMLKKVLDRRRGQS